MCAMCAGIPAVVEYQQDMYTGWFSTGGSRKQQDIQHGLNVGKIAYLNALIGSEKKSDLSYVVYKIPKNKKT